MKDTTYTRYDIWNDGSSALVVSESSYTGFLVGMMEMGNFRDNGLSSWTWREDTYDVVEYTVLWFYASAYDVESDRRMAEKFGADSELGRSNGYIAGKTVAMVYLKERRLCDCCEHEADNDE